MATHENKGLKAQRNNHDLQEGFTLQKYTSEKVVPSFIILRLPDMLILCLLTPLWFFYQC